MLNYNGTLKLGVNHSEVVNERPGYVKAVPTMIKYNHPVLGIVLVKVLKAKFQHGREIQYYNLEGEIIRLPFSYFGTELAKLRLCDFRWSEYKVESLDQPWFEDILQKWDDLQGQEPLWFEGKTEIQIQVSNYPTASGDTCSFVAYATLESKELPFYNPEFPHYPGQKNNVVGITPCGQEVDLVVYFCPEKATYWGSRRTECGDYFGEIRRVAAPARPLNVS